MMNEKKFFRVRLASNCAAQTKMINGITLTKQWQVKVGEIGDFAKFPDVEAQVVVKAGNSFIPANEAHSEAVKGNGGASSEVAGNPAPSASSNAKLDFNNMTVAQLKNYLVAKGVAPNELQSSAKPELIERAEFQWAQL